MRSGGPQTISVVNPIGQEDAGVTGAPAAGAVAATAPNSAAPTTNEAALTPLQAWWRRPLVVNFSFWWGVYGAPILLMVSLTRWVAPTVSLGAFLGAFFATTVVVVPFWIWATFARKPAWDVLLPFKSVIADDLKLLALFGAFLLLYTFGPAIGGMEIRDDVSLRFSADTSNFADLDGYAVNTSVVAEFVDDPGCLVGEGVLARIAPLVQPPSTAPTALWAVVSVTIYVPGDVERNCLTPKVEAARERAQALLEQSSWGKGQAALGRLPARIASSLFVAVSEDTPDAITGIRTQIATTFSTNPPSSLALFDPRVTLDAVKDLGALSRRVSDALTATIWALVALLPCITALLPKSLVFLVEAERAAGRL